MLNLITKRSEVSECHKKFKILLSKYKTKQIYRILGFQGGDKKAYISFSDRLNIRWSNLNLNYGYRYWNAFGAGDLHKGLHSIVFEINYPSMGVDFRVAGAFARDEQNNVVLLHSGKIGGGRKGIGKEYFKDNYSGERVIVNTPRGERKYCLVGALDSKRFGFQLSNFIHEVKRLKQMAVDGHTRKTAKAKQSFKEEFWGKKEVSARSSVIAECNHGLIVSSLNKCLVKLNKKVANDRNRDLYIINSGRQVTHVFEIKPSLALQSIYTAIGQLTLNNIRLPKYPKLFLVVPAFNDSILKESLKRIGIRVLEFKWINELPSFMNISSVI